MTWWLWLGIGVVVGLALPALAKAIRRLVWRIFKVVI